MSVISLPASKLDRKMLIMIGLQSFKVIVQSISGNNASLATETKQ